MLEVILTSPALWGFAGAISYAGPLLSACMFAAAKDPEATCTKCVFDFTIALIVGTVAAAAFTPLAQELLHKASDPWLRALGVTIGLCANKAAPKIVDAAPEAVMNWIRRMVEARK